jgi:hypothetical protein
MEHVHGNTQHIWFESMEELKTQFLALLRRNPANVARHMHGFGHGHHPMLWYGAQSAEEARHFVANGWPALLDTLRPMITTLQSTISLADAAAVQIRKRRRKRVSSDHGDTVDITRVWNGDIANAWKRPARSFRMVETERYATIYVDLCMNADRDTNASLWRAALAVSLVNQLTTMRIHTEVWCGSGSADTFIDYPAPGYLLTGVRIKEFTQPMNDERVAALTHAAMFRTWGFSMMVCSRHTVRHSLGRAEDRGQIVWPLQQRKEQGERVFRISQVYDEHRARQELHRILQELAPKDKAA